MTVKFKTKEEAIAAGYWSAGPARKLADGYYITDTSRYNEFGYSFALFTPDGTKVQEAVPVWLSEERNRVNNRGCIVMMFPPDSLLNRAMYRQILIDERDDDT